jgi:hypothetical protein
MSSRSLFNNSLPYSIRGFQNLSEISNTEVKTEKDYEKSVNEPYIMHMAYFFLTFSNIVFVESSNTASACCCLIIM